MEDHAKREILLETGTNEIEIMEFTIDGNLYGINVAKVREIMMSAPVKWMPHAHPAVEGIFKPRDKVITVVDLPLYITGKQRDHREKDLFIVTNFNKMHVAFRVDSVEGISRISWQDIQKPDSTISGGEDGVATGIAQCGDNLVSILDLERIVAEIAPETSIQVNSVESMETRPRDESMIWVAEDSILLSRMIRESLERAGYVNLRMFPNGAELWEALETNPQDQPALVITDLEMPQMDGHRLTKLIKSTEETKSLPVVIFSSLITAEMRRKGQQVGADEQLSKPEICHLIGVLDELLSKKNQEGEK